MTYLDDEVKRLQAIVDKLDSRVKALETRQLGGAPKTTAEQIRMILIGPPGAGMTCLLNARKRAPQARGAHLHVPQPRMLTKISYRQGHSGTQDQGEVQLLPSGKSIGP